MRLDLERLPDVTASAGPGQLETLGLHMRAEMQRVRADPLRYGLPPHAGQEKIHTSEKRHILLVAANRWGKSVAGMRETLWRATGTHPYRRLRPHRMIWCGFPDFPFYSKVTKLHFDAWCPPSALIDFNDSKKMATIRRADGGVCLIFFVSYDMGRDKWQGAAVDFMWLDEEHPEDIYKEATARLIDTRGTMLQTLTPVSGMGWIHERIYLPAKGAKADRIELVEGALAGHDELAYLGVGRTLVPHLDRDQILRFAEEIPDEDERSIRIFGRFRSRSGSVYKMFDPALHVVPAFDVPEHWYLWGALDPGFHGFAAAFFAMSPEGRIYAAAEYISQDEPTETRFRALSALHARLRPEPVDGEPCVFFVDTEDPQVVLELNLKAQETGASLVFASLEQGLKARKAGILRTQQMLAPSGERSTPREVKRARPAAGEPTLYLFDSLHSDWRVGEEAHEGSRLAWELAGYVWKRPKRGTTIAPDDADEDSAGGAHMLAALRYGLMARLGAPEPLKEERAKAAGADAWVWQDIEELEERMLEGTDGVGS